MWQYDFGNYKEFATGGLVENRKDLSRLTADIPKRYHVKIKSVALLTGKTIREVLIDAIDAIDIECMVSDHIPNKETLKVLEEIKKGENLIRGKEEQNAFSRSKK